MSKGYFPCLWFDDYKRMSETRFPEVVHFKTEDDHKQALQNYKDLECSKFEDYHDYYLSSDVILLATAFQSFRKDIYQKHKSDLCYFMGLPGLSWSLAVKNTDYTIKLLDDVDQDMEFQNGLQGGPCQVNQRYAKKRNNTQLAYLDVNGLYGHCLEMNLLYVLISHEKFDIPKQMTYDDVCSMLKDENHC